MLENKNNNSSKGNKTKKNSSDDTTSVEHDHKLALKEHQNNYFQKPRCEANTLNMWGGKSRTTNRARASEQRLYQCPPDTCKRRDSSSTPENTADPPKTTRNSEMSKPPTLKTSTLTLARGSRNGHGALRLRAGQAIFGYMSGAWRASKAYCLYNYSKRSKPIEDLLIFLPSLLASRNTRAESTWIKQKSFLLLCKPISPQR